MEEQSIYNISSLSYDTYNYDEIENANINDAFFVGELYRHIDNIILDIKSRIQSDISIYRQEGYDIPEELWSYLEPSLEDNIKNLKKSIAYLSHISDMTTKVGILQAKIFYEQINVQINNQLYAIYWDINSRLKTI
jgi:hypothetical protein